METNEALDHIFDAIQSVEDYQKTKDIQKLEDVLPLVLVLLKHAAKDLTNSDRGTKFYAPVWVSELLKKVSDDNVKISDAEFELFRNLTARLTKDDFKHANPGLMGYHTQFTTYQEIDDVIAALRHYFKLP